MYHTAIETISLTSTFHGGDGGMDGCT